jgi:hypothetical protein
MAAFNSDLPAMLVEEEEERVDTNMWDDPVECQTTGIRYDEKKAIVAASLNRLIECLTSVENYGTSASIRESSWRLLLTLVLSVRFTDSNFLHTFITTYQSFTTPHKLFEKLLQRYHIPEGRVEDKNKEAIRLRYGLPFLASFVLSSHVWASVRGV